MWIFLDNAFLSIVAKGDPSGKTLLVRSRRRVDLQRAFPSADIVAGAGTDYRYRARIDRAEVAERLAQSVRDIQYGNFKSGVKEPDRHDTYMEVWDAMYRFQTAEKPGA
jgi:hypothetical protein